MTERLNFFIPQKEAGNETEDALHRRLDEVMVLVREGAGLADDVVPTGFLLEASREEGKWPLKIVPVFSSDDVELVTTERYQFRGKMKVVLEADRNVTKYDLDGGVSSYFPLKTALQVGSAVKGAIHPDSRYYLSADDVNNYLQECSLQDRITGLRNLVNGLKIAGWIE